AAARPVVRRRGKGAGGRSCWARRGWEAVAHIWAAWGSLSPSVWTQECESSVCKTAHARMPKFGQFHRPGCLNPGRKEPKRTRMPTRGQRSRRSRPFVSIGASLTARKWAKRCVRALSQTGKGNQLGKSTRVTDKTHKQKPQHPVRSARSGIRSVERVAMRRACPCGAPFWSLSTHRDRWTGDGRGLTWADYLGKAGPANPPNPQSVQWGERLMSASFAGKVVVVTGGASGIGEACAAEFARRGARVVVADFNVELGQRVAAKLSELTRKSSTRHSAERAQGHGPHAAERAGAGIGER